MLQIRFALLASSLFVLAVCWSSAKGLWAQDVVVEIETTISPLNPDGRLVRFDRDIAPVLRARCLECHGPDDAKNDFRVDDRELLLDLIEPEDAGASSLYTDYLTVDDEDMLMPPKSHGGPLSSWELALIRVWIDEGADWPDDVAIAKAAVSEVVAILPAKKPLSLLERVWAAQGFLHPATVHFPIALLMLGAGFVVLGWKWPSLGTQIPLACLLIGSVSAVAASVMGFSFATEKGYGSWDRFDAAIMDREVFWHRWSGVIVAMLSTGFAIVALISLNGHRPRLTATWKIGLLVCAAIVGAVGHQGGEMTYGKDLYPKALRILTGTDDANPSESVVPIELNNDGVQSGW